MGWGEPHGPLIGTGTTAQIALAQEALTAVGIDQPNLALAAVEAAGVIDKLREEVIYWKVSHVVATNPGIDPDEVRRTMTGA